MSKENTKKILVLLLIIWGSLVGYRTITFEEPKRVPLKYEKGKSFVRGGDKKTINDNALKVRFALLSDSNAISPGKPKDIFAPIIIKKIEPEKKVVLPQPLPIPEEILPTPEELEEKRVREELKNFRYLGYLNKKGEEQAFLAKDKDLFVVREKDRIIKDFFLKVIDKDSIIIQEKNTMIEITIDLTGG
ncbi:MAG: hypothetical protein ACE5EA_08740 [Nitrospirota bacterium]